MTEGQIFNIAPIDYVSPTYDISVMQEGENLVFLLKQITVRYISDVTLNFNIYYIKPNTSTEILYTIVLPAGNVDLLRQLPLFMTAWAYRYEITGNPSSFQLIEVDLKHFLIQKGLR